MEKQTFNQDKKTNNIVFRRPDAGHCPQYKNYVIRDRYSGRDRHGNECYEYALFRLYDFELVKKFRTRKQAYMYLHKLTGLDQISVYYHNPAIICNDHQYLGVLHVDTMYRINKKTRVLEKKPAEALRLTPWYMRQSECIADAKLILKSFEESGVL